MHQQPIED